MDEQEGRKDDSGADDGDGGNPRDDIRRIRSNAYDADQAVTTYTYIYDPGPPLYEFEHLKEKGVFALTATDGKTEYFRDRPTRYLVVEPDAETGEFAPAVKGQKPVFLWLCREEREVR
jgi:hypothetical protein